MQVSWQLVVAPPVLAREEREEDPSGLFSARICFRWRIVLPSTSPKPTSLEDYPSFVVVLVDKSFEGPGKSGSGRNCRVAPDFQVARR